MLCPDIWVMLFFDKQTERRAVARRWHHQLNVNLISAEELKKKKNSFVFYLFPTDDII